MVRSQRGASAQSQEPYSEPSRSPWRNPWLDGIVAARLIVVVDVLPLLLMLGSGSLEETAESPDFVHIVRSSAQLSLQYASCCRKHHACGGACHVRHRIGEGTDEGARVGGIDELLGLSRVHRCAPGG
jgi:hypothetical protein